MRRFYCYSYSNDFLSLRGVITLSAFSRQHVYTLYSCYTYIIIIYFIHSIVSMQRWFRDGVQRIEKRIRFKPLHIRPRRIREICFFFVYVNFLRLLSAGRLCNVFFAGRFIIISTRDYFVYCYLFIYFFDSTYCSRYFPVNNRSNVNLFARDNQFVPSRWKFFGKANPNPVSVFMFS